ncbi:MAG: arginine--tRNA ligase [Desulfobulbus propionicus]|nr:MAG: arginine--tRNA ligase [Desulfobulbus propionicus]
MIKSKVQEFVDSCVEAGIARGLWSANLRGRYSVEIPKHAGQGDFATNFAMVAASIEKANPRELAQRLVELAGEKEGLVQRLEIAGPGFVNIFLFPSIWSTILAPICEQGEQFGPAPVQEAKRVLVEFVSANPTGPLSVGHGRNAVLGDTIARLLAAVGHEVHREYYFNDAGRQMRVLARSTKARYCELLGREASFPEDGYQGDYISDIARSLIKRFGDAQLDAELGFFKKAAQEAIFADIEATLKRIGIRFDSYFNEHTLYETGQIEDVVDCLRSQGLVYEKEDAVWFKTSALGQEQDRVIIKSSGEPTYRLPDIAYHREKFRRGFSWMVNVFGADHIATVPDVLAGVRALGYDDSLIKIVLYQFVTLLREGKQVKMSTRKATFVTVDELVDEVGVDALRFFFLMRKPDSQLEFDLDLAKKQNQDNPVYYVQYAHARMCSMAREASEQGLTTQGGDGSLLREPEEYALLKTLADYPALVRGAADDLAPHRILFYLMELAGQFHSFYNKHKVLGDDPQLSKARLSLCSAVQTVIRNGLSLLGIQAPTRM